MTTGQLIVVAIAIFAASFVQVVAGFGFALLCMPIMVIAVPVETAVVVSTLVSMLSTISQAVRLRDHAQIPLLRRLVMGAFLGMPLGLVILNIVSDFALQIALGVSVLIATALLARNVNLAHLGPRMDVGLGFLSGVLNTSLSTNGPPIVFDLQARQLTAEQFRATISATFSISSVGGLAFFIADGKITRTGIDAALIALPAWAVGQSLGWPVRKHFHGDRFRRLVLVLLLAAGTSTIAFAVF
ncbi:MAG: sulfite exporter TauE/SafE family protein [Actinobacteria bacterium]|nr:sulfite exporter TauE/SafE family protein [Actinomycetota bacterium]